MYMKNELTGVCEKVEIPNCLKITIGGDCEVCTSYFYPVAKECKSIGELKSQIPQCEKWDASKSCT